MARQNLRTYTLSLTAGVEYPLGVDGEMYAVVSSSGEFSITFDESNRITKAVAGTGGRFRSPYKSVSLLSTTSQVVTLVMGFGEYNDSRSSVNATINTTISPSDTLLNPSDISVLTAATLLVAADATRKEVLIHVPSGAAHSVRVGSASVTASAGLEIEQGSTLALSVESAVYAISSGAGSVSVSIIDLKRP